MNRHPEHPYDEYVRHTRQLDPVNDPDWRRRGPVEDEVLVDVGGRVGRVVIMDVEQEAPGSGASAEVAPVSVAPPSGPPAERPEAA